MSPERLPTAASHQSPDSPPDPTPLIFFPCSNYFIFSTDKSCKQLRRQLQRSAVRLTAHCVKPRAQMRDHVKLRQHWQKRRQRAPTQSQPRLTRLPRLARRACPSLMLAVERRRLNGLQRRRGRRRRMQLRL